MAKQLGCFCLEADSWGFQSLYDVAFTLQTALIDSGSRDWNNGMREAFDRGLDTLSALVERCETDVRWDYALNETLERLRHAGPSPDECAG